jgi:hypothetical protein
VTKRKGRRSNNEIVSDQDIAKKCKNQAKGHSEIEFFIRLLCDNSITEVDDTKQGEAAAADTFKCKIKAVSLIKIVQNKNCGNYDGIDRKYQFISHF